MDSAEFLANWYGGAPFTLTTIPADGGGPTGQTFTDPAAAAQWASLQNAARRNVYFHVNPGANTNDSGKLTKAELSALIGWHVDLDPPAGMGPGPDYDAWRTDALARVTACNPSIIINSGRGLQAYWRLRDAATATPENIDRIEQMNRATVRLVGGDKAAVDASRIMKLPGTIAYPNPDKSAAGWQPSTAAVIGGTGGRFDSNQFTAFESWLHASAPVPPVMPTPAAIDDGPISPEEFRALCDRVTRKLRGGRNAMLLDLGIPDRSGGDASDVWGWMMRATAEVTSRNDVAREVLLNFGFVDKTYPPSGSETRRQKCERELREYWQAQVTATADRRATGSLEGLKELAQRTDPDAVDELASHAARLSAAERDALLTEVKQTRPDIAKPLQAAIGAEIDAFRVAQGEQQFDAIRGGELSRWFIVGDDGTGSPAAINRHTGRAVTFGNFLIRFKHLPTIAVPAGDKIKLVEAAAHWWSDPETERYAELAFDPDKPVQWRTDHGEMLRNAYLPAHRVAAATGQDASPYLHILASNYPDPGDQEVILGALAFAVQNPGKMLLWAPVLQGAQGCGKGLLIKQPLSHCIGGNLGVVSPKALVAEYNGYMYRKTTVVVDEIGERSKAAMTDLIEELKEPVAENVVPYRLMRTDPFSGQNFTCWFFMTNHIDSMLANDPSERRWAQLVSVLQTPEAIEAAFPADLWNGYPDVIEAAGGSGQNWFTYYRTWWSMGGNEAVRGMLETRAVATPGRAPMTTTRADAVAASEPDLIRIARECIAAGDPGFRGGFVSSNAIRTAMEGEGLRVPAGRWMAQHMRRLGYCDSVRFRPTPAEDMRFPAAKQARLYFNDPALSECETQRVVELYDAAQAEEPQPKRSNIVPMKPPGTA